METLLELARRHVAEGKKRIARQEALVTELIVAGHGDLVPEARKLLSIMQDIQGQFEKHLAIEEKRRRVPPPLLISTLLPGAARPRGVLRRLNRSGGGEGGVLFRPFDRRPARRPRAA